jgi:hypothetical protein
MNKVIILSANPCKSSVFVASDKSAAAFVESRMLPDYPSCPDCGGVVVRRSVLPDSKAPPNTEYLCMRCLTAFRREGTQLVKVQRD